ncbi:hypothetical protein V6Z93_004596 [Aspergillus fumigatus]
MIPTLLASCGWAVPPLALLVPPVRPSQLRSIISPSCFVELSTCSQDQRNHLQRLLTPVLRVLHSRRQIPRPGSSGLCLPCPWFSPSLADDIPP